MRAEALTLKIHRREYIKVGSRKQLNFIYESTRIWVSIYANVWLKPVCGSARFPFTFESVTVCGREWIRVKIQAGICKAACEAPAWSQERYMNVKLFIDFRCLLMLKPFKSAAAFRFPCAMTRQDNKDIYENSSNENKETVALSVLENISSWEDVIFSDWRPFQMLSERNAAVFSSAY